MPGTPMRRRERGRDDERERERGADRHADRGHRARAYRVARQVGGEGEHRGGDGARALDDAADDGPADRRRPRRDEAAEREDEKACDDDGLSSPTIRRPAEGNLQQRLRESVGSERDADQRVVEAAGECLRIQREHRQDDEHAEHSQAEDAGEADGGATLGGRHAHGRSGSDGGRRAVVRHGRTKGRGRKERASGVRGKARARGDTRTPTATWEGLRNGGIVAGYPSPGMRRTA